MTQPRILVVDDDRGVRTALQVNLGRRDAEVQVAEDVTTALRALHEAPFDLVLTDVKMPDATGLDLLARIRRSWPDTQVIVMTGFGSVSDAVAAMKGGAADYLIKPVERDELYIVVDRALERRALHAQVMKLQREINTRYGFDRLIGTTPVMQRLYEELAAVADTSATVLLQGPTGTGKELLAHALHHRSRRATGPFVPVHCAAIPETLLESELFGHEKGAFTGAFRQHHGRFEQADGGTIFLDEIGEIDLTMQVKLLRVLESSEVQRIGGTERLRLDIRVIAATNRDLKKEIAEGRFREDLFYRLNVVGVRVPSLYERLDDIPQLVQHFVERFRVEHGRAVPDPSRAVVDGLRRCAWPGNVRQLEHVIERAVLLHREGEPLTILPPAEDAPPPTPTAAPPTLPDAPLPEALEAVERGWIQEALEGAGGVQAQAARRLGISRSNLNYRIQKLGL